MPFIFIAFANNAVPTTSSLLSKESRKKLEEARKERAANVRQYKQQLNQIGISDKTVESNTLKNRFNQIKAWEEEQRRKKEEEWMEREQNAAEEYAKRVAKEARLVSIGACKQRIRLYT